MVLVYLGEVMSLVGRDDNNYEDKIISLLKKKGYGCRKKGDIQ